MSDTRNVSYSLANLGPWSNSLIAGLGGSSSRVNMLEPLDTSLPVIRQNPGSFAESMFVETETEADDSTVRDRIIRILTQGAASAPMLPGAILLEGTSALTGEAVDQVANKWLKNILIAVLGIIIISFGLWILLAPTVKTIIKETATDAV